MNTTQSLKNVIYGLSCLCHPEKGFRYVGQTIRTAEERLYGHKFVAQDPNAKQQLPVMYWIRKHGADNVVTTVLEAVPTPEDLNEAEIRWIAELGTFGGKGLNLSIGGSSLSGYKHTDATREKMKGRPYSDYTRAKMSESAKRRGAHPNAILALRARTGDKHHASKLTDEEVRVVKERLWNGEAVTVLAEELDVKVSLISHISTGVTRSSVPWPIGPRREPPTKALMSAAGTGRTHTESSKQKMSEILTSLRASPEGAARYANASKPGENNPQSKVTDNDVRAIRARSAEGETYRSISKDYPLTDGGVAAICKRRTWKHVV